MFIYKFVIKCADGIHTSKTLQFWQCLISTYGWFILIVIWLADLYFASKKKIAPLLPAHTVNHHHILDHTNDLPGLCAATNLINSPIGFLNPYIFCSSLIDNNFRSTVSKIFGKSRPAINASQSSDRSRTIHLLLQKNTLLIVTSPIKIA